MQSRDRSVMAILMWLVVLGVTVTATAEQLRVVGFKAE